MRIFVYEDCWSRRKNILTRGFPVDAEFYVFDNFEVACMALNDIKFDLYMLDHDISVIDKQCQRNNHNSDLGCDDCIKFEPSGHDLAKYIVANNLCQNCVFLVHSDNPTGSINIVNTLKAISKVTIIVGPCSSLIGRNVYKSVKPYLVK